MSCFLGQEYEEERRMGTWGPGLYQNDVAEDVKAIFCDQLHRGKTSEQITEELIEKYMEALNDTDDSFHFWCALADTQWNYGRLIPRVKQKALECIDGSDKDLASWMEVNPSKSKQRKLAIEKLQTKLNTPQPPEKRVSQYRLYQCPWKIGDVFALPLSEEVAESSGFAGQYLLIEKVSECIWHPGHMIPVVHLKLTKDGKLPACVAEYDQLEYVQIRAVPYSWRDFPIIGSSPLLSDEELMRNTFETDEFGDMPSYRIGLITTSRRSLPSSLTYLGNFSDAKYPPKEYIFPKRDDVVTVSWKDLPAVAVKRYWELNRKQLSIYSSKQ